MAVRSNSSRERILDSAQEIILQQGFSGTSIEDILEKAAITKGGFFYHFDSKTGLARALVERYLKQDDEIFSGLFAQADSLSEDPLHRLLIFLKLFADTMSQLEDTHPGCLVASFTYEPQQIDEEVKSLVKQGVDSWKEMLVGRLSAAADAYPMNDQVSIDTLADMFTVTVEGGILLSRIYTDNQILVDQILAYRTFLRSVYGAN